MQNTLQNRDVLLVFGAVERVLQHLANVRGLDPFHLPVRIETLALVFTLAKRDDIKMARIAMKVSDQPFYLIDWPLDPLEEDAAVEHQHSGYAACAIVALSRLDDATNRGFVNAFSGTAAVGEMEKSGQGFIVQLKAASQTVFV